MPSPSPKISCLCVTYNRSEFFDFLLWNFNKQTWKNRELIVVDGSKENHSEKFRGENIFYHHMPVTSNIPQKRNRCLELATGDIITWFDDDDWQHPKKCEILAGLIDSEIAVAGGSSSLFYSLVSDTYKTYSGHSRLLFNSLGVRRELAQSVRFEEKVLKASDSKWMRLLTTNKKNKIKQFTHFPLFFWLSHSNNISNADKLRRFNRKAGEDNELLRIFGDEKEADDFFEHIRALRLSLTGSEDAIALPVYKTTRRVQTQTRAQSIVKTHRRPVKRKARAYSRSFSIQEELRPSISGPEMNSHKTTSTQLETSKHNKSSSSFRLYKTARKGFSPVRRIASADLISNR